MFNYGLRFKFWILNTVHTFCNLSEIKTKIGRGDILCNVWSIWHRVRIFSGVKSMFYIFKKNLRKILIQKCLEILERIARGFGALVGSVCSAEVMRQHWYVTARGIYRRNRSNHWLDINMQAVRKPEYGKPRTRINVTEKMCTNTRIIPPDTIYVN